METDLLPIALELAQWGADAGADLPWIEAPPRSSLQEARVFLRHLGAIDGSGRITAHGKAMARLGVHPRLGHMLLRAHSHGWLNLACELSAVLSERDPLPRREAGCDLMRRLDWLRAAPDPERQAFQALRAMPQCRERRHLDRLIAQLRRRVLQDFTPRSHEQESGEGAGSLPGPSGGRPEGSLWTENCPAAETEESIVSRLISWAYPDRIALSRGRGDGRFLLRGGRGAILHRQDPLASADALAIAAVDGHGQEGRVLLAVRMDPSVLEEHVIHDGEEHHRVGWDETAQRVRGEKVLQLGALTLERRVWRDPEPAAIAEAMLRGIRQMGLECLPWTPGTRQLQQRLALAHRFLGDPWPDRCLERLESDLDCWLRPHILGMRSRADLERLDLVEALWGDGPWARRQELERLLPQALEIPSGRSIRIDYSQEAPVLAVKLQEMFGSLETPTLLQGRLTLTIHLLSPAGRTAAITTDLAGFWTEGYPLVRREMRGRYPRHPWPEDPLRSPATSMTKARLAQQSPGPSHPRSARTR
jgi:ATP-dependent helicase HrpB